MKERREVIIMDPAETKSCNKGKLIRVAVNGEEQNESGVAK